MATTSISATGFRTGLRSSSTLGEEFSHLATRAVGPRHVKVGKGLKCQVKMKNNGNEGKGVFAPVVILARNLLGTKRFNQLRGKAIALHSQVITEFCKAIGADAKQRQELIRLAKKNGEKLGFLA